MTVHVGSFYNPHSPVVLHVHRNTRNHASSHLEMTCKMVDQNHTSELLAAAEEEINSGMIGHLTLTPWVCIESRSLHGWPMASLGK